MQKRTVLQWLTPAIIAGLTILAIYLAPMAASYVRPDILQAAEGDTNLTNLVLSGDLTVSDDIVISDALTVSGATALNGGLTMDTNKFIVANTSGNTAIAGTLSVAALATFTDNVLVDGGANEIQLRVQGYTTPTKELLLLESSDATDVFAVKEAPAASSGGDLVDLTDTFAIANGSDAMIGIDVNLTGANHTGSGNTLVGIDLDLTTADPHATESAIEISDTDWDYGIFSAVDQENYFFPSISSSTITTDTTDMFLAGATEIWFIHSFYCNFTTSFDCTGDNCTLIIGDGSDTDGLAVYTDGEMQSGDTEMTGAPAGWQGFGSTDTRGAYLAEGLGFVYTNDGIDADFGGTGVQNGSATCYLVYTIVHE
jgi:hypothetical protein